MIRASDIGSELTARRYASNLGPWPMAAELTVAIASVLRRAGVPHADAQHDAAGNCLTCGECGRCPGVHTFEEIQHAARLQASAEGAKMESLTGIWVNEAAMKERVVQA